MYHNDHVSDTSGWPVNKTSKGIPTAWYFVLLPDSLSLSSFLSNHHISSRWLSRYLQSPWMSCDLAEGTYSIVIIRHWRNLQSRHTLLTTSEGERAGIQEGGQVASSIRNTAWQFMDQEILPNYGKLVSWNSLAEGSVRILLQNLWSVGPAFRKLSKEEGYLKQWRGIWISWSATEWPICRTLSERRGIWNRRSAKEEDRSSTRQSLTQKKILHNYQQQEMPLWVKR